jgi:hypothetical protein
VLRLWTTRGREAAAAIRDDVRELVLADLATIPA